MPKKTIRIKTLLSNKLEMLKKGKRIIRKIYEFDLAYCQYPTLLYSEEKGWRIFTNMSSYAGIKKISLAELTMISYFFDMVIVDFRSLGGQSIEFKLIDKN